MRRGLTNVVHCLKTNCYRSSSTSFLVVATTLYVLFFAKYAQFETQKDEADPVVNSYRNVGNARLCPKYPDTLKGVMRLDMHSDPPSISQLVSQLPTVRSGGQWRPPLCQAQQKVAIIIPYRDRWAHLIYLLATLHRLLQRQQRHYRIYVVEQAYDGVFNKGLIMNIAFKEALKNEHWDCFIFHDVDMVPQNDHNIYECGHQPRHLSPALNEMRFNLIYPTLVGGVLALTGDQVHKVNGFSNLYWGWGAEDDDMSQRIRAADYKILRPPNQIGRYNMIMHEKREQGRFRLQLFMKWKRWPTEGINSLHTLDYHILERTNQALYTNITVDVGSPPDVPQGQEEQSLAQSFLALIYVFLNI